MREVPLIAAIYNHSTRSLRPCEALSRYGNDWTAAVKAAGSYRKKQQLQQQMHHRQKQKQQLQQRVSCSTCGIHNLRSGDRTAGCALNTSSAIQRGASTRKRTANLIMIDQSSLCSPSLRSLAATAVKASPTSRKRTAAATPVIAKA
jgi:hypothetical protein